MARDPYKAYLKERREEREFIERMHKRQMRGNVLTSLAQSLVANRPLQVASVVAANHLTRALGALVRKEEKWYERAFDAGGGLLVDLGAAAYLANSDGGVTIQYDVPDVESPGGGGAALNGGGPFPFPAPAARAAARSRASPKRARA